MAGSRQSGSRVIGCPTSREPGSSDAGMPCLDGCRGRLNASQNTPEPGGYVGMQVLSFTGWPNADTNFEISFFFNLFVISLN